MFASKIIKNLSIFFQVTIYRPNVGNAFLRIFVHLNSYFVGSVFPR